MAYRQVHMSLWAEPWFEDLGLEAQHLFLYLVTAGYAVPCGFVAVSRQRICWEAKIPTDKLNITVKMLGERVIPVPGGYWLSRFWKWQGSGDIWEKAVMASLTDAPTEVQTLFQAMYPRLCAKYPNHSLSIAPIGPNHSLSMPPGDRTGQDIDRTKNRRVAVNRRQPPSTVSECQQPSEPMRSAPAPMPVKPTKQRKMTLAETECCQEIEAFLEKNRGYSSPRFAAERNAVITMLRAGHATAEIQDAYRHFKGTERWAKDKLLSMNWLAQNIGAWRNGGAGDPGPPPGEWT